MPYTDVKETGLPWLPEIPQHWDLIPNKALLRQRKQLVGATHTEFQLLSLTKQGVIVRDLSTLKGKFSADFGTSQEVLPGDLVFCFFDVPETPRTVGLSRYHGMITGAYTILQCIDPRAREFLEAFYIVMDDRKLLSPLYSGLRNTIPLSTFLHIKTPVPPPCEQRGIISFINYVDRQIQQYIHAKEKLIKLLEEQKQAIIHRAFTRGVNFNGRVKPSGVQGFEDIPEHWQVRKIKQCSAVISKGTTPSTEGRETLGFGPVRFLKAENIVGGRISDNPLCFIDDETHYALRRSQLKEDDILFVIAGATLGKTAVVERVHLPANTNQAVAFIRPNSLVVPEYLAFWLQSPRIRELTWLSAVQSAQPNLSMANLGNFVIPLPALDEQYTIVAWLKSSFANLINAISRAQEEITLFREYRSRQIADVVTGKLDVRDVATQLRENMEESRLVDDTEPGGGADLFGAAVEEIGA